MVDNIPAIHQVKGEATDVDFHTGGKHRIHVDLTDGGTQTIEADGVFDVTGRRQLLGRKFDLIIRPEGQRDCFWFRVKGVRSQYPEAGQCTGTDAAWSGGGISL